MKIATEPLEEERLEAELLKGLRSGKGISMTAGAWKRLTAEAAKHSGTLPRT